jgi:threonine dehydrogenase-like Zn-dependent dehydrogenase
MAAASLFHMAGVSRSGVRITKIKQGDLVALIGLGMIGQMSAQAARRAGRGHRHRRDRRSPRGGCHAPADRVVDGSTEPEDAVREEAGRRRRRSRPPARQLNAAAISYGMRARS